MLLIVIHKIDPIIAIEETKNKLVAICLHLRLLLTSWPSCTSISIQGTKFTSFFIDRYILLLLSNGSMQVLAGICGFIAVCIFGANGDNRDWMPYWQHNDLSWSYAFACVGCLLLIPAGCLFLVEAKRARYRRFGGSQPASQYSMEAQKPSAPSQHHTDI